MTDLEFFIVYIPDPKSKIDHLVHARSNPARPEFVELYNGGQPGKRFTFCGMHLDSHAYPEQQNPICFMCIESANEPVPHTFRTLELTATGVE